MAERVRIEIDPMTPELEEKARRELRETPELREESLAALRKLLEKDETIYFGDDDDTFIRYLRPTKFYPESAHDLMKRVATFKHKYHNVLDNLLPEQEYDVFYNHDVINVLVDRDQDGRRILVAKLGSNWDPRKVTGDQIFRLFYLIHEAAMLETANQINGVVVVLDFRGMGFAQVKELGPAFSLRLLSFIQEAMPLRLKEVHIVNQPYVFNMVWQVFKPFLQEKLKQRIFFHGSKMSSFHKYIAADCLPPEYGGKKPEMDYSGKNWYPELLKVEDIIKLNNTYGLRS